MPDYDGADALISADVQASPEEPVPGPLEEHEDQGALEAEVPKPRRVIAVLHVHGMGEQQRYGPLASAAEEITQAMTEPAWAHPCSPSGVVVASKNPDPRDQFSALIHDKYLRSQPSAGNASVPRDEARCNCNEEQMEEAQLPVPGPPGGQLGSLSKNAAWVPPGALLEWARQSLPAGENDIESYCIEDAIYKKQILLFSAKDAEEDIEIHVMETYWAPEAKGINFWSTFAWLNKACLSLFRYTVFYNRFISASDENGVRAPLFSWRYEGFTKILKLILTLYLLVMIAVAFISVGLLNSYALIKGAKGATLGPAESTGLKSMDEYGWLTVDKDLKLNSLYAWLVNARGANAAGPEAEAVQAESEVSRNPEWLKCLSLRRTLSTTVAPDSNRIPTGTIVWVIIIVAGLGLGLNLLLLTVKSPLPDKPLVPPTAAWTLVSKVFVIAIILAELTLHLSLWNMWWKAVLVEPITTKTSSLRVDTVDAQGGLDSLPLLRCLIPRIDEFLHPAVCRLTQIEYGWFQLVPDSTNSGSLKTFGRASFALSFIIVTILIHLSFWLKIWNLLNKGFDLAYVWRMVLFYVGLALICLYCFFACMEIRATAFAAYGLFYMMVWNALNFWLSRWFGDVAIFTNQNENSPMYERRRAIVCLMIQQLDYLFGTNTVTRTSGVSYPAFPPVLERGRDEHGYREVIIYAHSLGCIVSYYGICDYFRRLFQADRREAFLRVRNRLKAFLTTGCHLDIVEYLFDPGASDASFYDRLRVAGRFSVPWPRKCGKVDADWQPFAQMYWFNIWNWWDVFSSKLFQYGAVINSRIALYPPLLCHSYYMKNVRARGLLKHLLLVKAKPPAPVSTQPFEPPARISEVC